MTLAATQARRSPLGDPLTRWMVFIVLGLAGLSPMLVIIGCFMAVVPGLVLALAPNVVIYGAVVEAAAYAWRRTRNRALVWLVLWAAAVPLAGVPFALDRQADREVAEAVAGDFSHAPGPPPRTVAFVDPAGTLRYLNGRQFRDLGNQVIAIQSQQTDFTYGLETGPSRNSLAPPPEVDAIVSMNDQSRRNYDSAGRSGKLGLGLTGDPVRETQQWSVWRCNQGRCVEVQRLTQVRVDRLWPLLLVGFDTDNYGIEMDRAWQRDRQVVNRIDMDAVVAAVEAGRPITPKAR